MISCLILTYNEASNIGDCIASIPWRDDIQVLDSLSTDLTREIAESAGAHVTTRPFDNYASQRNFGLKMPFASDWIVMIDADERITPDLAAEIEALLGNAAEDVCMLLVRRKDIFLGRWLRRTSGYPTWFARVFRKGTVHVAREINEEYFTSGTNAYLRGHLIHFPLNKGVEWWFERHNRYSTLESRTLALERLQRPVALKDILSFDALKRRAALKQALYRLPFRPFIIFLYLYIVRLGFLDGKPGYLFAQMRMAYEVMIDAKTGELIRSEQEGNAK